MTASRCGFTLIELLVVVAIIALLAVVAVPNLLEAQSRAKTGRVKADCSVLSKALEMYRADTNTYPEDYAAAQPSGKGLGRLTSPVAYLTSIPIDPFGGYYDEKQALQITSYSLGTSPDSHPVVWALASAGPDREDDTVPLFSYPGYSQLIWENPASGFSYYRYDPTNGTISKGDILRTCERPEV